MKNMNPYRVLIVDDDIACRENIEILLQRYFPAYNVAGSLSSVEQSIEAVERCAPDLVFLDVEMPPHSGFDLLERLPRIDFKVVFVTAHQHYALRAIKFCALDYLLKPVDVHELRMALERFEQTRYQPEGQQLNALLNNLKNDAARSKRLAIPSATGIELVETDQIMYCQSENNYTRIFLQGAQVLLSSYHLKEYEDTLVPVGFIRVHQSYLVNPLFIKRFNKTEGGLLEMSNGMQIQVARRRKEEVLRMLKQLSAF